MTDRPTMPDGAVTWAELLAETTASVGDARHARWMCETATSSTPDEFHAMLRTGAGERAVAHLDAMIVRVRAGEPIQYVLGSWGFRRLDLAVDARVLIPRPETELVAGIAIELAGEVSPTRTVADLGTGSGAIGLAMADELPISGTTVWLTDESSEALAVARANAAGLGRSAANVRVAQGSWFDALPDGLRFDVIVSNPPYVADKSPDLAPEVAAWEPGDALFSGADGLDDIRVLAAGSLSRLVPGGWLVLEHGYDQGDAVRSLLDAAGLVDTATRRDFAGLDRITVGRSPRAPSSDADDSPSASGGRSPQG